MASTIIGTAAIELLADASKFETDVGGVIDRTLAKTLGVTKAITGAVVALGGAVGALALKGGISRALTMEAANVQLARMGYTLEEIDYLIGTVDKSFDGTIFTNPEGFQLVQQLLGTEVAMDEVGARLTMIADLAAHANVPLDQLGDIFLRIEAKGRANAIELNRLSQAGVVLAPIAEQLGTTTQGLRDMAAAGELNADVFIEAAMATELYQGAAKAAGDTSSGAWKNVISQTSRLGELVVMPLFGPGGPLVTFLQATRTAIIELRPYAEELGDVIETKLVPAVVMLTEWVSSGALTGGLERLADRLGSVWAAVTDPTVGVPMAVDAVVTMIPKIADAVVAGLPVLSGAGISLVTALVDPLVEALPQIVGVWLQNLPKVAAAIVDAAPMLAAAAVETFVAVVDQLVDLWPDLVDTVVNDLIPQLIQSVETMLPMFVDACSQLLMGLVDAATTTLPALVSAIPPLLARVAVAVVEQLPVIVDAGLRAFTGLVTALFAVLPELIRVLLVDVVPGVLVALVGALPEIVDAATVAFVGLVDALTEVAPQLVEVLITDVIPALVVAIIGAAPDLAVAGGHLIRGLIVGIVGGVKNLLGAVGDLLGRIVTAVKTFAAEKMVYAASLLVQAMRRGVIENGWRMLLAVGEVVGKILGGLAAAATAMFDAGAKLLTSLWDGLKSVGSKVVGWVDRNVVQKIRGLFPSSPAKWGPFAGSGAPFLLGQNLMGMIGDGIDRATPGLLAQAEAAMAAVSGAVGSPATIGSVRPFGAVNVTINFSGDTDATSAAAAGNMAADTIIRRLADAAVYA